MQIKTLVLAAALSLAPSLLQAQFDFSLDGKDIQVHSFATQGFMYVSRGGAWVLHGR